jgi:3-oxoacyl-[acyl-carrier protein] reductase
MNLNGKIALVTGASKGIGRAIALELAQRGAHVAFTYLSSIEAGQALEAELTALGVEAAGFRSDAASYAQAEQLIADILARFGKLDIVVNNAGITRDGLLMRMPEQAWDDVLTTNLKSVFNITKAATKPMMKARTGSLIHISSVVGVKGNAGQANYAASKAGMIGFSKSIAAELGSRGIRSNVVAPGFIETEMTSSLSEEQTQQWAQAIPLKKAGTVQDVASAVAFLASDMSSYITGQTLIVDGGMTL